MKILTSATPGAIRPIWTFRFLFCLLLLVVNLKGEQQNSVHSLFVDFSPRPDAQLVNAFDLSVLSGQAEVDLEPAHELGRRAYATIDIAAVKANSFARATARKLSMNLAPTTNEQVFLSDPSHENWMKWAVSALADPVAKKGFDGFVIRLGPEATLGDHWRVAALELAQVLKRRYQDKQVLLDADFGIGSEAAGVVDGLLALGVHTHADKAVAAQRPAFLRHAISRGMLVLAVEFGDASELTTNRAAARQLADLGAVPFVTTQSLNGVNLGPVEEISRRVLVLHGWDASENGGPAPAAESTVTARFLHAPLEWLGCEVEYLKMEKGTTLPTDSALRGVVIDPGLILNPEQQTKVLMWLRYVRAQKVPLLLAGMPFRHPASPELDIRAQLGLGGTCALSSRLEKASVARMEASELRSGTALTERTLGFMDLQAPEGARVVLSCAGQDALGTQHRFDQAFHASWGSAWMEPAALSAGPQVDLFAFASTWLGTRGLIPAPDTTTREGRQTFYALVSGRGFTQPSALQGLKLCSEIMREQVLSKYFLPFTVAVSEAELRGTSSGASATNAQRHELIARAIYDLPHVAAASNPFSPSETAVSTPEESAPTPAGPEMQRQVAGSMSYIHQRLLPSGKSVSLMVWPQAPTAESLAFCQQIGVPSLSPAPRRLAQPFILPEAESASAQGMVLAGASEVFATSQFRAGEESDPAAQLTRLQASAKPGTRRISPVGVHFDFQTVQDEAGIAATTRLLDWCATEPLHAITAADHAASVRDAMRTRILQLTPKHWIVLNDGRARTLRLPASAGVPDLVRSRGIHGYKVQDGQLYLHTAGLPRTEIVLQETTAQTPHLHLVESSGRVQFIDLAARRAAFQVRDWRPVEIVLGGFEPFGECVYQENARTYAMMADADGRVRLELSRQAAIIIESRPAAPRTASN